MATNQQKKKTHEDGSALFIPAGVLLGMGIGFLVDNLVASMFIGLGAGMVAFAIMTFMKK